MILVNLAILGMQQKQQKACKQIVVKREIISVIRIPCSTD
jgi:hypothetical protein